MSLNKGILCFVNGLVAPLLGIATYYVLYSLGLIEQALRTVGYEPWLSVAIIAAILTIVNIIVDIFSALSDPVCAFISVIGMWTMVAILYSCGLYDLVSITLPGVLISTIASTLAIIFISYMKH